jgi:hypothetical protein
VCKPAVSLKDDKITLSVSVANLQQVRGGMISRGNGPAINILLYEIIDGQIREVPRTAEGKQYFAVEEDYNRVVVAEPFLWSGSVSTISFPPLGKKTWTFDLKEMFRIERPGEYTVVVRRKIRDASPPVLLGDTASFTIREN